MRNELREWLPGVYVLYRDGEKCHGGDSLALPSELEFWLEIDRLRKELREQAELTEAMKEAFAVRIAGLELLERKLAHGCMDVSCAICNAGAKK